MTLDDLLLDEAALINRLAAIIQSQIAEGEPAPSRRSPALQRRAARAEETYRRFLNQVQAETGLDADEADTALDIVLTSLVRRLTPGEAKDLISQLPSLLHPTLFAIPAGPDRLITRESIEAELSQRLNGEPSRATELLLTIGAVVTQNVSEGQMEDIRGQLPDALREVFSDELHEALPGSPP